MMVRLIKCRPFKASQEMNVTYSKTLDWCSAFSCKTSRIWMCSAVCVTRSAHLLASTTTLTSLLASLSTTRRFFKSFWVHWSFRIQQSSAIKRTLRSYRITVWPKTTKTFWICETSFWLKIQSRWSSLLGGRCSSLVTLQKSSKSFLTWRIARTHRKQRTHFSCSICLKVK